MMRTIKKYLKNILIPEFKYRRFRYPGKLEKLGSHRYGGWTIPTDKLNSESICYLAGAGEDISFDVGLAGKFGCDVFIFDPTPRAKKHFDAVVEAAQSGDRKLKGTGGEYYELEKKSVQHLHFETIGLWKQTDTLKFYSPLDESHVSHSITNLQHTDTYFSARVERLSEIMKRKQHHVLDVLKLDIEGAEFDVIDTILEDNIPIKTLCIEFHQEADQPGRIQLYLDKLHANQYAVVAREESDFTFINRKYN